MENLAYILRDKIWEKLIYFSHNLTLYEIPNPAFKKGKYVICGNNSICR
jgi:hypothetical protein